MESSINQPETTWSSIMKNMTSIAKPKKNNLMVPDLLLSYTYFLNNNHSCHLTIGYDVDDFTFRIILYKNNMFHTLLWEDWNLLFGNAVIIQNHFNSEYGSNFLELPKSNGNSWFKISIRNNEKCLMSVQHNKKLVLDTTEWNKLFMLMPYINSIATWYSITWQEIENFYHRYLQTCIKKQVLILQPHEFFMPGEQYHNFYNQSRMFNELPILCRSKLEDDLRKNYEVLI